MKAWIHRFITTAVLIPLLGVSVPLPALATKVDCETLMMQEKEYTYELDRSDVRQCMLRGYDPPVSWRKNRGKNSGIKVMGATGYTIGGQNAPESPAGARNANASVKKEVIRSACEFPPRFKLSSTGKVDMKKGSCLDFFNEVLKDKDGSTPSSPPPPISVPENDPCPVDSDTTGIYGVKQSVAAGGAVSLGCGGIIPSSNVQLVLNRNATHFVLTQTGSRTIWFYKKTGAGFSLTQQTNLPSFLCKPMPSGDSIIMQKSVDLTPAIGQVITYANATEIAVRLESRASMDPNYIPPYDPNAPELYLIIPIEDGVPKVPPDCADESQHFQVPNTRRDITIESPPGANGECSDIGIMSTRFNDGKPTCPVGATMGADGKCRDSAGLIVPSIVIDDWKFKCPDPRDPSGYSLAADQTQSAPCPGNSNLTTPDSAICPSTGSAPVDGKCPELISEFVIDEPSCGTASNNCDVVSFSPDNSSSACTGKMQYGVLNRPNTYFKSGTTTNIYPVQSQPFAMMDTVKDTKFFASPDTPFYLQASAPPVTFNEGGMITLKDRSIIIMNPPAIVEPATGTITLPNGGERVTAGGTQLASFTKGQSYVIPAALLPYPIYIKVSRSVMLPEGFTIPTMNAPYVRLPKEKLPE